MFRRVVLPAFAILTVLLVGIALDALWLEPDSLRAREYPLVLEGAPKPFHGLRIAVIADLHGGSRFIDEDKIARVVALTNAAKPDLILLTGDYVITGVRGGRRMPIETIARLLKPLKARLGVFAVLGNHDHWAGGAHIAAAFRAVGIPVLSNQPALLSTPHGSLYLAGIDDDATNHADPDRVLAALPPGQRALCFTHAPDVFVRIPDGCLLTIAGHTHGGQIDLPLLGRLVVPSRYGERFAAGLVHEGRRYLFVSTGIGTSIFPIRFGVPPEISVLDVR